MRVWDIHPGYLSDQSLLGEHREVHAVHTIIVQNKRGYAHHPETMRWRGSLGVLRVRHQMIVAEMDLRGFGHHSPMGGPPDKDRWPQRFIDPPARQLAVLARKYGCEKSGRIPLPRDVQQLWAQHKYSMLARDPARYREVGRWVSNRPRITEIDSLMSELVRTIRSEPPKNRLYNAVEHLWGYVKDFVDVGEPGHGGDPFVLMRRIQELVLQHRVRYLMESTALSDLAAWVSVSEQTPRSAKVTSQG